jgi:hypothetical protein
MTGIAEALAVAARPDDPGVAFERAAGPEDELRAVADQVRFVEIGPMRALAVDGDGAPAEPAFQEAIGALYPVAYGLHFALKRRGVAAPVGALEGLWWAPDQLASGSVVPAAGQTPTWRWTLFIRVPDDAGDSEVSDAIGAAARKRPSPALGRLRVVAFEEGHSAQILHIGPYAAEQPTIERLHTAIAAAGLQPRGRHHEIYLGDPRRSAPERLRTIIRQPVAKVAS